MNHLFRALATLAVLSLSLVACSGDDTGGGSGGGSGTDSGGTTSGGTTSSTTGSACEASCSTPDACPNIVCNCNDGTPINTSYCNNGCGASEAATCPGACSDNGGWG